MTLTYPIQVLEKRLKEINSQILNLNKLYPEHIKNQTEWIKVEYKVDLDKMKDKMIKIESAIKILNEFNFDELY